MSKNVLAVRANLASFLLGIGNHFFVVDRLSDPSLVCLALFIGGFYGNNRKLVSLESISCLFLLKKQV